MAVILGNVATGLAGSRDLPEATAEPFCYKCHVSSPASYGKGSNELDINDITSLVVSTYL
jgi:hypothetical protein